MHLDVNGTTVALKINTGAQANILPWKEFLKLQMKPKLSHKKQNLYDCNDEPIPTKASAD